MKAEFLLFISFSAVGAARSVFHPVIMDINLSREKTFVFNTTIEKRQPQTQSASTTTLKHRSII